MILFFRSLDIEGFLGPNTSYFSSSAPSYYQEWDDWRTDHSPQVEKLKSDVTAKKSQT